MPLNLKWGSYKTLTYPEVYVFLHHSIPFFLRKIKSQLLKCVSLFCFTLNLVNKIEHRDQRRNSFLRKHFNLHASIFCDTIFVPHDSNLLCSLTAQVRFFRSKQLGYQRITHVLNLQAAITTYRNVFQTRRYTNSQSALIKQFTLALWWFNNTAL
jgi:hypothetical protein